MPSRLSPQAHHEKLLYIPIVSAPLRVFIRPICLEKQWANLNNLGGIDSSQLVQLAHTT